MLDNQALPMRHLDWEELSLDKHNHNNNLNKSKKNNTANVTNAENIIGDPEQYQ